MKNSKNVCMLFLGLIVIVFLFSLFKNTKKFMETDLERDTRRERERRAKGVRVNDMENDLKFKR